MEPAPGSAGDKRKGEFDPEKIAPQWSQRPEALVTSRGAESLCAPPDGRNGASARKRW